MAWWEGWVDGDSLQRAFEGVKSKFADGSTNWNRVAGPTAALWLTLKRAGWVWTSASTACDNLWRTWDFLCDPPCAVAEAMRRTVRFNRFQTAAQQIPGLIPDQAEAGTGRADNCYVIVDFAMTLCGLATGKVSEPNDTPEWERKHARYLLASGLWRAVDTNQAGGGRKVLHYRQ